MKHLQSLFLFIFLPLFIQAQNEPNVPPSNERGVYAIWYTKDMQLLNLSYIKGGQIALQWADLEPEKGKYNFTQMDEELKKMQHLGKLTTLQVNGNKKPVWLYKEVPCHPEKLSQQISDKQGSLMYWHPGFIKAYSDFIKAYAAHLKHSAYLTTLAGVRMNFNAFGTEHTEVPEGKRSLDQWIVPVGIKQGQQWSEKIAQQYKKEIAELFFKVFDGIKLFVRNNLESEVVEQYDPLFSSGKLMLFHTSSEMEPRGIGSEQKPLLFKKYALPGKTLAYAESWADSWGIHGVKRDPRWVSPPKWNYWRLLYDLSLGVSMPAIYGNDLEVAYSGKLPDGSSSNIYQSEFTKAFKFAVHYAGYHASPAVSPGAWIAFRYNLKNISYDSLKQFTGNYSFLMQEKLPDSAKGLNVNNVGPADQRFGAWAKILPQGKQMQLILSSIFANSLKGKAAVVRVVYYDSKSGSFSTAFNGQTFTTELKGTERWKTIELPVASASFAANKEGAHITITALSGDITLHMVNVERGNGLPHDVTNISYKNDNGDVSIKWETPADFDVDSIKIYEGTNMIRSVSATKESAKLNGVKVVKKLTLKTVDEAGRESTGVLIK